jgi:hypothetical protein
MFSILSFPKYFLENFQKENVFIGSPFYFLENRELSKRKCFKMFSILSFRK